jgi:hypothetical protein
MELESGTFRLPGRPQKKVKREGHPEYAGALTKVRFSLIRGGLMVGHPLPVSRCRRVGLKPGQQ